ncbi:hypothetical protein [Pseudomonas sp. dw_358]|uniref:hypothetical protein n=1 Tax=Pseudomonas sp. dw_358 TaxID=2720083 RepID=UPI0021170A52|nr:hypothetical protein [Pseudomonas sp. dw_358]
MGYAIGQYGGITVMIPAAALIGCWLWASASRKALYAWLITLLGAYTLVGASKIIYKGWGVGAESLNIAVISGHAMNTCLVVTTLLSLLFRQIDHRLRWVGAGVGLLFSWWFACFCVAPDIHPLSEALAGVIVGTLACSLFLWVTRDEHIAPFSRRALAFGFVVLVVSASFPKYTAEAVLGHVAVSLSGAAVPYDRAHWRSKMSGELNSEQ